MCVRVCVCVCVCVTVCLSVFCALHTGRPSAGSAFYCEGRESTDVHCMSLTEQPSLAQVLNVLKAVQLNILKGHYVVLGEVIQTQNFNIYNINKLIMQTQKCFK